MAWVWSTCRKMPVWNAGSLSRLLPTEFAGDEERVARFEREARALAALNHQGIAVLYEIGELEDTRNLAMEYVEGKSLQERLAVGPLSRHCLIDYTVQVADALEHAYLRGILCGRDCRQTISNSVLSGLLKITGPNLFAPYFSVSALIIKQFGRLFSA